MPPSPAVRSPDHNDVLAGRDSGFLQIHAETCQEVLDSILMAYRIAEDPLVCLPVIVNLDGFYLSFTREPVIVPEPDKVRVFLPPFRAPHLGFKASTPHELGPAVLGGATYSYFRDQIHLASMNALHVHEEAAIEFERLCGRRYDVVEGYRLEDAEDVLIMTNAFASKGKGAVDAARAEGKRVGLLRVRMVRPWPADAIRQALQGRRAVAVLDQNLSPGQGGILFQEVAACLYHEALRPRALFVRRSEDGEIPVDGLRRELREETGQEGLRIGPPVWERRFVVEHQGRVVHAHETYFVVQTDRFSPDTQGLGEQELAWFSGFRWWRLEELANSTERTSPDTLPTVLMRVAEFLRSAS